MNFLFLLIGIQFSIYFAFHFPKQKGPFFGLAASLALLAIREALKEIR